MAFCLNLQMTPLGPLESYDLTLEEKAAFSSGDVRWIENHVGKLDKALMTWLKGRLEQEKW